MRFPAKETSSYIWVAIPVDSVILQWYACGADWRTDVGHVTASHYQNFSEARITKFSYPWYTVLRSSASRDGTPLILVINKKRKHPITISYPTTFNKSPTRMPPGSNIHKHFLHFFLLLPTTLYKKKNGVKVLLKECLFSYQSRSRTPQAWSRGDEVSVFSSTQVLKEDPFCLNPVHSLYTEKVN